MDKMSNSGTLPWDQALELRSLRDCGVIRCRGFGYPAYVGLKRAGLAIADTSPSCLYTDFRLTEDGRGIAG